jgi:hypothetical protein
MGHPAGMGSWLKFPKSAWFCALSRDPSIRSQSLRSLALTQDDRGSRLVISKRSAGSPGPFGINQRDQIAKKSTQQSAVSTQHSATEPRGTDRNHQRAKVLQIEIAGPGLGTTMEARIGRSGHRVIGRSGHRDIGSSGDRFRRAPILCGTAAIGDDGKSQLSFSSDAVSKCSQPSRASAGIGISENYFFTTFSVSPANIFLIWFLAWMAQGPRLSRRA